MTDFNFIFLWWFAFFAIGIIFLPTTVLLFSNFIDKGYIFSKAIGLSIVSYIVFIVSLCHILPFSNITIFLAIIVFIFVNAYFLQKLDIGEVTKKLYKVFILEELFFFIGLFFWAYIRGHEPSIHGLEKFMDFGFINSILRTTYFPPKDMWFSPFPINYYYFGHLATAVIIKLTNIPSQIGFNIMLATICGLTFSSSFSIGINLLGSEKIKKGIIAGGILTALLVTMAGNIHTVYSLFHPYNTTSPKPPWELVYSPGTFPNAYWYANATRFIPFTIHEFPIYSFVVADLHGHVLDIPFVLLSIALLFSFFKKEKLSFWELLFFSFLLAVMYMTNAWDGGIYLLAGTIMVGIKFLPVLKTSDRIFFKIGKLKISKLKHISLYIAEVLKRVFIFVFGFIAFVLPFSLFFSTSSIVHGIGIMCAPQFLIHTGRIGPLLFEANHCQKSEWWELLILYGFFSFLVFCFLIALTKRFFMKSRIQNVQVEQDSQFVTHNLKFKISDKFILCLIALSTLLIIIPEFAYIKDIYPQYFRANTMFKLVYQAFIMLSVCSGFIIASLLKSRYKILFFVMILPLLTAIFVFPYFAISSYYNTPPTITFPCKNFTVDCVGKIINMYISTDVKNYKGLDGEHYLKLSSPADYYTIQWMNKNITGQPTILEAQGDSYTDYDRISSYTGLPIILGWTVHEWLWRGSYDIPAPRITEVQTIYETSDAEIAKTILKKYDVKYVYVGDLERQKYPTLSENKFKKLGKIVFQYGNSRLYKLN